MGLLLFLSVEIPTFVLLFFVFVTKILLYFFPTKEILKKMFQVQSVGPFFMSTPQKIRSAQVYLHQP